MFSLNKQSAEYYTVDLKLNSIGEIYREVDGYYVFAFLTPGHGCYSEYFFQFVADNLQKLNAEWLDTQLEEVNRYVKGRK